MNSFSDLIKRIDNARGRVGITKHPAWYRGHSETSYLLLPSILRTKNGLKHERNLFAIFRTQAGAMLQNQIDSWSQLGIMQHYGVPTRLLDWSESLDVALFFAICEDTPHPCIWVLNPYRLNNIAVNENVVFDQVDEIPFDYYQSIRNDTWPHSTPLAIAAPWTNERIRRQQGCFTVHGRDLLPLDTVAPKVAKRVDIPTHLVNEIREYFKKKNFGFFDVYPDLPGLAMSLKQKFRL